MRAFRRLLPDDADAEDDALMAMLTLGPRRVVVDESVKGMETAKK